MSKSKIEWTESVWNPVTGCAKVSAGCKHCYAEREWVRLSANPQTVYFQRKFNDVMCHPERLSQPYMWAKPRKIFVNSMSDLFHPDVPFEFIASVFAVMSVTTRHTYQILTKRPERMLEFFQWLDEGFSTFGSFSVFSGTRLSNFFPDHLEWKPANGKRGGYDNCGPSFPFENVWLGVSVENQETANERIPLLLETPATVRWVSVEPLLDSLYFNFDWLKQGIEWVVVGGESGHKARPMHPEWVRIIRDQCAEEDVPFLFKQWGEWVPMQGHAGGVPVKGEKFIHPDGTIMGFAGKKAAGRLLDGVLHDEYPEA